MSVAEKVATGLTALGYPIAICLFSSQIPMFRQMMKHGSSEGYPLLPTLSTLATAVLWAAYCTLVTARTDLAVLNGIGALYCVIYFLVYLRYTTEAHRRLRVLAEFGGVLAFTLGLVGVLWVFNVAAKESILGTIVVVINVIMLGSPALSIGAAVKALDASRVPGAMAAASLISTINWGVFATLIGDPFILAPNIAGFFLSTAQLLALGYIRMQVRKGETGKAAAPVAGAAECHGAAALTAAAAPAVVVAVATEVAALKKSSGSLGAELASAAPMAAAAEPVTGEGEGEGEEVEVEAAEETEDPAAVLHVTAPRGHKHSAIPPVSSSASIDTVCTIASEVQELHAAQQ